MAISKKIPYMYANLNWKDLEELKQKEHFVLLFPIGATESHGPHCPVGTDAIIALEACLRAAEKLHGVGYEAYVLPPLAYTVAECARKFPGTISISPEVSTNLISEVCLSVIKSGMSKICIFNSHFEPAHLKCIYDAIERVEEKSKIKILFTDITRKKYSSRLTEAFQKGETHADRYETSIVMAVDQSLVDEERRKSLPYLPINLVDKLFKEHLDEFMAFGMAEAYCGDPAAASVEEGEALLELLSTFIIEDVERLFSGMGGDVKRGVYGR